MARRKTELKTFNRGLVSRLGLARTDLERTSISAEVMTNWMPRNLGSMMLRPGTSYIGNTASNNKARYIPFVYANDDTALIEITDSKVRVWVDDELVTRPAVSSAVTEGNMDFATGWTDRDEGGSAVSTIPVLGGGASNKFMKLAGDGQNAAMRTQEVTVSAGDQNIEHALNIEILADPTDADYFGFHSVTLKVGSSEYADDYIAETILGNGSHSLSFTPAGNFWIALSNTSKTNDYVDECNVASSGVMELSAPWAEADLGKIRYDQSGDIIYIACDGYAPYKIERRSTTSWSVVRYQPEDGPFNDINITGITIDPNVGNSTTLTASNPLWKSSDEGRLVKLITSGQLVSVDNIAAEDTWTTAIRVFGVNNDRIFTVSVNDRTDSTITLQRSLGSESGPWTVATTFVADTVTGYDDGLDNVVAWYRIGIATGDYGTDAVDLYLQYAGGTTAAVWAIQNYTSSTVVVGQTLVHAANFDPTANWYLGGWSDTTGYPNAVAFHEGRLCWFGRNKAWLSVSDSYDSFDDETIGDSGPITRTIGSGPVDKVQWALSLSSLTFGTDGREFEIRGSKDDEPLTPSTAGLKDFGTQGAGNAPALKMDRAGLYVQRGGVRLREVTLSELWEYQTADLTSFNPEIGKPGITHIALQRQPDNRVHCVRSDGTVALLLHDPAENVTCWVEMEMADATSDYNNISSVAYDSKSFVTTSQDGSPGGIFFKEDGLSFYVLGAANDTVYQYLLGTAWDISTATYTGTSIDLSSESTNMNGLFFSPDGTRMFVTGTINAAAYSYTLTNPWNVGTAVYETNFLPTPTTVWGLHFDPTGTRLYTVDAADVVNQYQLDTAWDLSTATATGKTFDVSSQAVGPRDVWLSTDGKVMWVLDSGANDIYQYDLTTAWDILTAEYNGVSLDTSSEGGAQRGIYLTTEAESSNTLYVYTASQTDDTIYQYSAVKNQTSEVEDVVVLPGGDGDGEDAVYYSVKHIINGATVRFLEKWSLESECVGGTQNKNIDAHITGTVTSGVLTGLSHLEGERVYLWVNGADAGYHSVVGGQITGVTRDGSAVAGLSYKAQFKSAKLGSLLTKQQIARLGVILDKTHYQGLRYGPDFDHLDELPLVEDGFAQAADTQHDQYDEEPFTFDGTWDTNSRLCLEAESPRNVTLLAAIIETEE